MVALRMFLFTMRTQLPLRPWSRQVDAPAAPLARRAAGLVLWASCVALLAFLVVALTYAGAGIGSYLVGLARGLRHSGVGHNAYLMGKYSEDGWWYYFLYAYLIKTPIGTLLIVAASLASLGLRRRIRLKDELFLWIPIALIVLITSLWKVNIGLRHLLPIYPFLYLAAGRLVARPGAGAAGAGGPPHGPLAAGLVVACLPRDVREAGGGTPPPLSPFY